MKKLFTIFSIIAICLVSVQIVYAKYGLDDTAKTAELPSSGTVPSIIGDVIGNVLTLVGVLFLILMIYGGITWMTARGNEQQTGKALNTITAAVIGLVIVIASYAITNFVFQSAGISSAADYCKDAPSLPQGCTPHSCDSLLQDACIASICCDWNNK